MLGEELHDKHKRCDAALHVGRSATIQTTIADDAAQQIVAPARACADGIGIEMPAVGETLSALTSGFAGLEPFLLQRAEAVAIPLGLYRPMHISSHHANFARAGIPAFRLVAGFNEPNSATRLVLTPQDTREKISREALTKAADLTHAILSAALDASAEKLLNGGADLQVERLAQRAARRQRHAGKLIVVRTHRFAARHSHPFSSRCSS